MQLIFIQISLKLFFFFSVDSFYRIGKILYIENQNYQMTTAFKRGLLAKFVQPKGQFT